MTNIVIRLCDDWALGYDNQQWIVYKRRQQQGKTAWRPMSFIASKKLVLLRVIAELGCVPTADAQRDLDQLPDTFRAWLAGQQQTSVKTGSHRAVSRPETRRSTECE